MKTEGQIEAKYMQIEKLRENGGIKEEHSYYYEIYQKALEWVLKG